MVNCFTKKYMLIGITFLFLIVIIVNSILKKEYDSPLLVYALLWSAILGLYSLKLYGIYDVCLETEFVILLSVLFFVLGYMFMKHVNLWIPQYLIENAYNDRRMAVVYLVVVLLSLSFYLPNIKLFLSGVSVAQIKRMLVLGEIKWGGVKMQYIVRPFTYILIATSTYYLLNSTKKTIYEIATIIFGILFVIFEFFGTGSKTVIMYYALALFFPILGKIRIKFTYKMKKMSIIGIILVIGLAIYMGIESIYFYLCGCVPMLDKIIVNEEAFYIPQGHTYGFLTFNSCVRLLIKGFHLLGINIDSKYFEMANTCILRFEYTTQISTVGNYNAFHTYMGDFFVDFGIVGVIILSFVFGAFCMYVYRIYKETGSVYGHILYCIIIYYIVFSMVRFQLSNTFFGFMLIYTLVFLKMLLYKKGILAGKGKNQNDEKC